jgi:hypothetical protein
MIRQITERTSLLDFYRSLLAGCQIVDGKLVDVVIASGTSKVTAHGLGRLCLGAIVVENSAASSCVAHVGAVDGTSVTVHLTAAVVATVRLWVF